MAGERLPYGKQISPRQINLRKALELVRDLPSDRDGLYAAIGAVFWPDRDERNRRISGMNAFLSMRHYGLVTADDDYALTDLAMELLQAADGAEFNSILARHILLNLHGLQLVEVVDLLHARGERVNVTKVVRELDALGIDAGGDSGENVNPLRLWLEEAGVFVDGWTINSGVVKKLTGASTAEIAEIVAMDVRLQAILRALATITDAPPYVASDLRALAEVQTPHIAFDTKTFAERVLGRLEAGGWIDVEPATTGRGAKSPAVTPTDRFRAIVGEPLLTTVLEQTHLQDPASLRKPLTELLDIVDDTAGTSHSRGLALEGVCVQVLRMIGAHFIGWRVRGENTAGAEVDVVAESIRPPYLLIQMQSKASAITGREVVDREVGVAAMLKSNVILFVTAKTVGPAARQAAAAHMRESNLAILFLDGGDIRGGFAGVADAIQREWGSVRSIRTQRGQQRTQSLVE